MPASLVQSSSSATGYRSGGSTSVSVSLPSTPAVGNTAFIVGILNLFAPLPGPLGITDDQGNTWSIRTFTGPQANFYFIGYAPIGVAAGTTITFDAGAGSNFAFIAMASEWSGLDNADLYDREGTAAVESGNQYIVTASAANTGADRLVIALAGPRGGGSWPGPPAAPAGYADFFSSSSGDFLGSASYKTVSTIETSSADWGVLSTGGGQGGMLIVTFKEGGGGSEEAQSESITFSDSQSGSAKFLGAQSETQASTDSQTAVAKFLGAQSETLTLSDSQASVLKLSSTQEETIAFSDSQVGAAKFAAAQPEAITFTDSQVGDSFGQSTQVETISFADSQGAAAKFISDLADSISLSDVVDGPAKYQGALADTITLTDSAVSAIKFQGLQDESITLADSQDAVAPAFSQVVEQITLTDAQSAIQTGSAQVGEYIAFSDVVARPADGGDNLTHAAPGLTPKIWPGLFVRYEGKTKRRVEELEEEERERLEEIAEQAVIEAANARTKKAMKASLQASMRAAEIELAAASYLQLVEQAALLRMDQIEEEEIAFTLLLM